MQKNIPKQNIPVESIHDMLSSLTDWALLRNADVIGNFKRGGDCDIILLDIENGKKEIIKFLGNPVRVARRSYVLSIYYPWGHIDLTDHYYWRGLRLCSGQDILTLSSRRNDWPVVSDIDEAIILLLSSLLWGGFVKVRYIEIITDVFDKKYSEVDRALNKMLGSRAAKLILLHVNNKDWKNLELSIESIRYQVFVHHFTKYPLQSLVGQLKFYSAEILLRLQPNLPVLVLEVDEGSDKDLIKKLILEASRQLEYKCLVKNETSVSLNKLSIFQWFRIRSFQARNGLIVLLVNKVSIHYGNKKQYQFELENVTYNEVMQVFEKFQNKLRESMK